MGMSTKEIEKIMSSLSYDFKSKNSSIDFLGVFPSDGIPKLENLLYHSPSSKILNPIYSYSSSYNFANGCILNTDPSSQPGEHWVAFFFQASSPLSPMFEFFDSYGNPPSYYSFPFLKQMLDQMYYNTEKLQSINSNVCGQYCILYLYYRYLYSIQNPLLNNKSTSQLPLSQIVRKIKNLHSSSNIRDRIVKCKVESISSNFSVMSAPSIMHTFETIDQHSTPFHLQ